MYFVLNQTNAGYKTSKRLFTTELCFYEGRIDLIIKPNKEITLKSHPVIKNTRLGRLTKSNHCTEQRLSAIFERVNSWISFVCLLLWVWISALPYSESTFLTEPGAAHCWNQDTHQRQDGAFRHTEQVIQFQHNCPFHVLFWRFGNMAVRLSVSSVPLVWFIVSIHLPNASSPKHK